MKKSQYMQDQLWLSIKDSSREHGFENDWITIVSYYNLYEGKHVQVYINDAEKHVRYRVLAVTDDNSKAVCLNKDNKVIYIDREEAFLSKKLFMYNENPKKEISLKIEGEVNGSNKISYYV